MNEPAVITVDHARQALERATEPVELLEIGSKLQSIEDHLKRSGYSAATEELRPINEMRMRARWLLGQALAKVERSGGGRPKGSRSPDPSTTRSPTHPSRPETRAV